MSTGEYVFDVSMLVLFWIGVLSIIIAIILRIRRNCLKRRSDPGELSSTQAQEMTD